MRRLVSTFAFAVVFAIPAQARAQVTVGPSLAWHDEVDLGIGIWGMTPLPSLHENMSIGGDFTYFFPDSGNGEPNGDFSYFEINANLFYSFPVEDPNILPWVLGGLSIAHWSTDYDGPVGEFDVYDDTDIGLNFGGGATFNRQSDIQPFAGLKVELGGGEGFVLFGGIAFLVGG
jgi:hypothetical protein